MEWIPNPVSETINEYLCTRIYAYIIICFIGMTRTNQYNVFESWPPRVKHLTWYYYGCNIRIITWTLYVCHSLVYIIDVYVYITFWNYVKTHEKKKNENIYIGIKCNDFLWYLNKWAISNNSSSVICLELDNIYFLIKFDGMFQSNLVRS